MGAIHKGPLLRLLVGERGTAVFLVIVAMVGIVVPVLHLVPAEGSALQLSGYTMTLIGKYMTYALLAVAVDLVWAIAASCRWGTRRSSRSAAMPWGCTSC